MTMRCLHCTKRGGHTGWCPARSVPTPTAIMPPVETDDRPAEMSMERRTVRVGAPAWAVSSLGLGLVLMGLALVAYGVLVEGVVPM